MEQKKCIIWNTSLVPETFINSNNKSSPIKYITDCCPFFYSQNSDIWSAYGVCNPRAGGRYISEKLLNYNSNLNIFEPDLDDTRKLDNNEKIRLSGWIAKQNLISNTPPLIESLIQNKESLEKLPPIPNPSERAYLLLEGLVRRTDIIGRTFSLDQLLHCLNNNIAQNFYYIFCYALSYCNQSDEMKYLFNYLQELKLIKFNGHSFYITIKGFEKINTISNIESKTAFIAMWFDRNMDNLKESIKKAIKNAGYKLSLRIDEKEHINKIDDEILVDITKSRFVVCDLTSKEGQPRGSVYFEAGYAMGKNIPIIWTCDKKLEKERAFDIRQYNCLFWEKDNMDKFINKLQHRIENVIGKGSYR